MNSSCWCLLWRFLTNDSTIQCTSHFTNTSLEKNHTINRFTTQQHLQHVTRSSGRFTPLLLHIAKKTPCTFPKYPFKQHFPTLFPLRPWHFSSSRITSYYNSYEFHKSEIDICTWCGQTAACTAFVARRKKVPCTFPKNRSKELKSAMSTKCLGIIFWSARTKVRTFSTKQMSARFKGFAIPGLEFSNAGNDFTLVMIINIDVSPALRGLGVGQVSRFPHQCQLIRLL